VRQFSIVGEDGEYDRMLQVHCTMSFEPRPELRRLGSDSIWSATDRRRHWFEEVEQSDGFAALQTTTLLDMSIDGERL